MSFGGKRGRPRKRRIRRGGRKDDDEEEERKGEERGASNQRLGAEQYQLLLEGFDVFDHDKKGHISRADCEQLLRALGVDAEAVMRDPEVEVLVKGDRIASPDFVRLVSLLLSPESRLHRLLLRTAFELFSEGDPAIDLFHLHKVAAKLGDHTLDDQDLHIMIDHASQGSGQVSSDQFISLFSSVSSSSSSSSS